MVIVAALVDGAGTSSPSVLDVELDRLAHQLSELFDGVCCADAAREVWDVRGVVGTGILDDDRVLSHWGSVGMPACLRMARNSPKGTSLPRVRTQ
jgi:hypothetical protein